MERSHRPPPLTLTPPHSRKSSVSKTSTKGRSPPTTTISLGEDEWNTGRWKTALRVAWDFAHILLCMVLALIMAFFISYDEAVVSQSTG